MRTPVSVTLRSIFLGLSLLAFPAFAENPAASSTASASLTVASDDAYLWLEDVTGENALAWVAERNEKSKGILAGSESFQSLNTRFLEILDSPDRIPTVQKAGDLYYNFWRDKEHPRGIWRRTSLEEYRKDLPNWETVLDLDALGKAEGENWVWKGSSHLPPDYTRCFVDLSRGGADATVTREFDLVSKSFVEGGFELSEAKSSMAWRNKDMVYVGTDFGPGSMTTSGYPRIVKAWKRGTPMSEAATVYEGKTEDVWIAGFCDLTPGFERDFLYRGLTTFTNELYLLRDGKKIKIEKPDDAEANVHREWILIQLRTDWTTEGKTWSAGSLIVARFDDFLAGKREFTTLFEPSERSSLDGYAPTLHAIIVNELDNVKNRLYVWRHQKSGWSRVPMPGLPQFGSINVSAVDDMTSDDYFVTATDFLTPSTLSLGTAMGAPATKLKQGPAFFDATNLAASQHEAVSKDGTRIPYFQVAPKNLVLDGTAPALLTGYGGFEVSSQPYYSGTAGSGWLEKGGVLVVANIRGGGEFGPQWHQSAIKANRPRAYEDFIAVAEDLIQRKVTSPERLGCSGGSNGGLLVGNMLTMRPDLFHAIVCEQPLLDMQRYTKLLAGASWMEEYGDPDKPEEWAFIRTFSPYHNLEKNADYPAVLFTSSTRDDRVHPGHARKTVARLEELGHGVLYYENVEGGHAGAADNTQQAFMKALTYSFLWKELRPEVPAP